MHLRKLPDLNVFIKPTQNALLTFEMLEKFKEIKVESKVQQNLSFDHLYTRGDVRFTKDLFILADLHGIFFCSYSFMFHALLTCRYIFYS